MYKKFLLCIGMLLAFRAYSQDQSSKLAIIPTPVYSQLSEGEFIFNSQVQLYADDPSDKAVVFLHDYLQQTRDYKKGIKAGSPSSSAPALVLTDKGTENLPDEGYRMTIKPDQIIIAGKDAGLFYGIQSFIQLLPLNKTADAVIPAAKIEDYPRFEYRGMHLDVSRHFYPTEFIKKYIDLLAAYKLNNFHWHLTDDQGWRIEIKKYPKLTEVGGVRAQTLVGGHYWDRMPQWFDQTPYKGYYTQDEVREIVKYASDRYVNVIPEIEMPGHSAAALAAYPELSCNPQGEHKVAETFGIFTDIYCPSEKTFKFLEDVLTEVIALFPSKYIHLGGDEAPKDAWENSELAQKLIKKKKLKDEHGLQSYFIQRMEKFVNSKGRQIIGWDEILEGGLAPNATVMSWQGEEGGIAAAKQHHDVIMNSQKNGLYFNERPKGRSDMETKQYEWSMEDLYHYNPVPEVLTEEEKKYIKGVQADIWTEYVLTPERVEYTLLPRMLALSEIAWTPLESKNYKNFANESLPRQLARLDAEGIHYRVPVAIGPVDTLMKGSDFKIELKPSVEGAKIYYTLNGFVPNETDRVFTEPLAFKIPEGQQRELQTLVITPSGKRSEVTRTILYNRSQVENLPYIDGINALRYRLYSGSFKNIGELEHAKVVKSDTATSFNFASFKKDHPNFGIVYEGYINIEKDGEYLFALTSDGGSQLYINNRLVVDNMAGNMIAEKNGIVPLLKGLHKVKLKYFNASPSGKLQVYLTKPGSAKAEVPMNMFRIPFIDPTMTGIDGK